MKTKTFKLEVDGVEKEFLVRSPTLENQREAQKVYNQAFTDAIKSKSVVRAKLDDLLEDQGLWNDEKQAKFTELQKDLLDGEKRLAKGGFSLNEAKDLAIKMKSIRDEIRDLISVRTSLDNHSAEGQADNSRFNYLVSVCLVYNDTKQPVYKNMEEYLNSSTEKVAIMGAQNLANMLYGLDNDYESNLPENKFLKKFKFIDEKLRLVDKKGRLIDREGRLIDESGRFIDEEGNFVDKFGNKVDKDGEYLVDSQPFLDENGNPIILDEEKPKDDKVEPSVPTESPVVQEAQPVSASTEQTVSTT
ncbi:MAG: hypothetical protein EBQ89_05740 [Alphaproteobacteria bacterium]|nr:hypothetical protein [Alphaproteobacteria bacterium]